MNLNVSNPSPVLVVGAGIMGSGIAQIAAQAGHPVLLFDVNSEASTQAKARLVATFDKLVDKGKFSREQATQILDQIQPIVALEEAAEVALVVEAIVEQLEVKRSLFQQLETIVSRDCILATNTSSISVTAIANGLQHPGRLVGMHFFNPVPLMKLVEVVSGLQTEMAVAEARFALAERWGKVAVYAKSTPGFIVNRIARPFYAETLALLQEQAAAPVVLDACLRAVGFRMGPCELMDLIGHDTNFSVTQSVYNANFQDKRFMPSLVQQELVDGGLLGRKAGQGFYDYREGASQPSITDFPKPEAPGAGFGSDGVLVLGSGRVAELLVYRLQQAGVSFERELGGRNVGIKLEGLQLLLTNGYTATQRGSDVAVFDLPVQTGQGMVLAYAVSAQAGQALSGWAADCLSTLGFNPQQLADVPGLLVGRTLAMLINEAADAVHQGVCDQAGADAAMKLGVNYPAGPFEWLADWSASDVVFLLDALDAWYRGERYRVSPRLRLLAAKEQVSSKSPV